MKNSEENSQVSDVIADFAAEESMESNREESAQRKVNEGFLDWVSSIKSVKLAAKAKALWRHLNDKQTPVAHKAVIVAALLYCIVPADMVPDFIPLSGLLDDLAIVLSVLAYVDAKAVMGKAMEVDVETETSTVDSDCAS